MRIQLVSGVPAERRTGGEIESIYPPLGLMYIAAYARKAFPDAEFRITDGNLIGAERTAREIEKFAPDVLGLSITSFGNRGAYRLIRQVKAAAPETFVVAGGPHPTALPDEVLDHSDADVVVVGEGEQTFSELVGFRTRDGAAKKLEDIRGIYFRKNGRTFFTGERPGIGDLDSIPFPARDLMDVRKYPGFVVVKKLPDTYMVSSRGCPQRCTFCSNPVWRASEPCVRMRSPANIADEVYQLGEHGIKEFYDQCDEFNPNLEWPKAVCDEYIARRIDMPWKVQLRADMVDEELARKMARAGCWLVSLGIESGNQETLDGTRKHTRLEDVTKACELFKKQGIKVFGLFMSFNFWETADGILAFEDVRKTRNTLDFARRLADMKLIDYLSWSFTTPYPGSDIYDVAKRHGVISPRIVGEDGLVDWNATWTPPFSLPGVSDADAMRVRKEGSRLQASCLLRNGNVNRRHAGLYARRVLRAFSPQM